MIRVHVQPELFRWARERPGVDEQRLGRRFPQLPAWEAGHRHPTLKQLEAFARATYVPVGYFFLDHPPKERLPVPDLRTMGGAEVRRPSVNLLDTVHLCQRRQTWYQDHARLTSEPRRSFVGSLSLETDIEEAATGIRRELGFDLEERAGMRTWTEALRRFIEQAEDAGVLVMVSGVVGGNARRPLDPQEFRGFALADAWAPLVFVNGRDTKAAQMFTLAHELAHLWLGESGVSDAGPDSHPRHRVERWCNAVAAELLAPLEEVRRLGRGKPPREAAHELARRFKVSILVTLRRLHDAGWLSRRQFEELYEEESDRLARLARRGGGGDFYLTQEMRASRRFVRAVVTSTLEGHTLYREAFQLLGIRKAETFETWQRRLWGRDL